MADLILKRYENGLAILSLNAPPFNMLTAPLRQALIAAVHKAEGDEKVSGIVLWAEGRMFSSGGNIDEYSNGMQDPSLATLCDVVENCSKPVVAALHGSALGGGLELAIAAHGRIATPECILRLPEIKLGLLPGAGGTQRLPRLCGAKLALKMMLTGESISAQEGYDVGLIDRLSPNDLWVDAQDMVLDFIKLGHTTRTRDKVAGSLDPAAYQSEVLAAREAAEGPLVHVRHSMCQLVEAAQILPFDAGLEMESAAFETVRSSRIFLALKHIFFAEKQMTAADVGMDIATPNTLGVFGTGPQVNLLVRDALLAKMRVRVCGLDHNTHAGIVKSVHLIGHGRGLSDEACSAMLHRLDIVESVDQLQQADVLIDASRVNGKELAERYAVTPNSVEKPLLVLNTARDLQRLEALTGRKGSIMTLLTPPQGIFEVLPVSLPNKVALMTVYRLIQRLGRICIVANAPLRKPLAQAQTRAAIWALKHGASPAEIDAALIHFGYRMGVFQRLDLEGIDTTQANLMRKTADPFWVELIDRLCATGRLGHKTGAGFYDHNGKTSHPVPSPEFAQTVAEIRATRGLQDRAVSRGEIQLRDVAALVSAGCRAIDDAIVPKPMLVDLTAVASLGFPRWRGGPMRSAQAHGLVSVQKAIRKFEEDDPLIWGDSKTLSEAIKTADGFDAI